MTASTHTRASAPLDSQDPHVWTISQNARRAHASIPARALKASTPTFAAALQGSLAPAARRRSILAFQTHAFLATVPQVQATAAAAVAAAIVVAVLSAPASPDLKG